MPRPTARCALLVAIVCLAGTATAACGAGGPEGSREAASWQVETLPGRPGADQAPVLATHGDTAVVVVVDDEGRLRGFASEEAGPFADGEPTDTEWPFAQLAAPVRIDDSWLVVGSGGAEKGADGDEELAFEPRVFRSEDGLSWEQLPTTGLTGPVDVNASAAVGDAVVMVGAVRTAANPSMGGVRAAAWWTQDGVSWTQVGLPGADGERDSFAAEVAVSGERLVAVGSTGRHGAVWTSDDAGRTWAESAAPEVVGRGPLSQVIVVGETVVVSGEAWEDDVAPALASHDAGESWASAAGPPPRSDIEGYLPLWSTGTTAVTLTRPGTSTFDDPELCYADIEQCRTTDTPVTLWSSQDGDTWGPVDTTGTGIGEIDAVAGTDDGRVIVLSGDGDEVRLHTWSSPTLPVGRPPAAPAAAELVTVPEHGAPETGVRYHAPLYVHCGMDWLYLGDTVWRRTDAGPDVETGAGDGPPDDWPAAGQTVFGFATLGPDGVLDYSIGGATDEVIATYEQAEQGAGCD